MTDTTWKWATLDATGLELVQDAEKTLGADIVLAYAEGGPRTDPRVREGLKPAAAGRRQAGVPAGRRAAARRRRRGLPARLIPPPHPRARGDAAGAASGRPARARRADPPPAIAADVGGVVRRPPRRPALVLAAGFLALIAAGTLLLVLPVSAAAGTWTSPVTALFTATSAACVTGLVVVDTAPLERASGRSSSCCSSRWAASAS